MRGCKPVVQSLTDVRDLLAVAAQPELRCCAAFLGGLAGPDSSPGGVDDSRQLKQLML